MVDYLLTLQLVLCLFSGQKIELQRGACRYSQEFAEATFQFAHSTISRPLMIVQIACAMGERVLAGVVGCQEERQES